MNRSRLARVGLGIVALLVLQALAFALFRRVNDARTARASSGFSYTLVPGAEAVPEVELRRTDGSPVRLSQLRGRPVLVHHWATWCAPCRAELPGLLRASRGLKRDEGIEVLAVSDEDEGAVRAFFAGAPPSEVVRDESRTARHLFGVTSLPDTYLVDANGRIVARMQGPRDWSASTVLAALREVLGRSAR